MESNNWTQIDIANQALRLHDSVLSNVDRDVKYRLEHRSGEWITMSPDTALTEIKTGHYHRWTGPYDEAEVDARLRVVNPAPRVRTQEELMAQVRQVRKDHIRI